MTRGKGAKGAKGQRSHNPAPWKQLKLETHRRRGGGLYDRGGVGDRRK